MLEGLWTAEFRSSSGLLGFGTVIFDSGRVMGGHGGYYYKGTYAIDGEIVTGKLRVQKYNPGYVSVFGPLDTFELQASGSANEALMVLTGFMVERPEMRVSIICTKREEL